MKKLTIITTIFILLFTGCSLKDFKKYEKLSISKANVKKINIDEIDGFYEDDLDLALEVFKKDCQRAKRYELFKDVCQKVNDYTNPSKFFTENFTAYELYNSNGTDTGIITGYYEPLLHGSLTQSETYKYPIYKTPDDMLMIDLSDSYPELKKYRLRGKLVNGKVISYDDREDLNKRDDLEAICYVNDEVDLFFLQIQGSGKIQLDTGEVINVGYANQNGHKYFAIGRALLKEGVLQEYGASLQGIKAYLKDNPHRIDEILNQNRSYIFFSKREQGATGALGSELVGGRNLAVDKRYIPLGMPVFINTKSSVTKEKINRLMVAADVGGAIKGEIRADFFFGHGENAELEAGGMKEQGKLTILVPNN
ncbi:murein transglycosylase A [Arcobacter arenosus]|jgi:membrane-bound lytic murein transglycosylase A|uniref:peptidoglycan lytic exotransglycosylase n=1 Tax=Arcobacter arenosus TaxID=2576037 RepID=A0A5R8Y135_9BACT|nr:murein transglycosylase A [Arcobacter arenosus]TLP38496.1 peptidoglycan N-acetylmuramoylhydrolase [Arcobacter arenosus]